MGYRHPKNEVFILKDGTTYQECQNSECIVGPADSGLSSKRMRKVLLIKTGMFRTVR